MSLFFFLFFLFCIPLVGTVIIMGVGVYVYAFLRDVLPYAHATMRRGNVNGMGV